MKRLVLLVFLPFSACFSPKVSLQESKHSPGRYSHRSSPQTSLHLAVDTGVLSIVAGSVAGAVGVGVAYPLDALKTKVQTLRSGPIDQESRIGGLSTVETQFNYPSLNVTDFAMASDGTLATVIPTVYAPSTTEIAAPAEDLRQMNLLQLFSYLSQRDGFSSFFSGVQSMMMGQALIKAMAFSVNTNAIPFFQHYTSHDTSLLLAAALSGFVTSFPTAPVERIKVMMQAQRKGTYTSDTDCFLRILQKDGVSGFLTRGLGLTVLRDAPSYPIYFVLYEWLMETDLAHHLPYPIAPLLFGAFAGCMSWWPVYPIDCVKTEIQNKESGPSLSIVQVTRDMYDRDGLRAFWDGLDAKMLRAGVNHAVTFLLFDLIMDVFGAK